MAIFFNDTFTEPSSGTINLSSSHIPEVGTGWGGADVAANLLQIDRANDDLKTSSSGRAVILDSISNYDYKVTVVGKTGSTGSHRVGPIGRWNDGTGSGYDCRITGAGNWEVRRSDAGVITTLASGSIATLIGSFSSSTNYTLRLECIGSTISFYVNGTLADTRTDATYATGLPGVNVNGTSGRITSFSADSVVGGGGGNPAPTITSITPATGVQTGNTAFQIAGTNFMTGMTIKLDGNNAASVVVVNSTTATGLSPAGAVGVVDVMITNTDAQSATLAASWTYTSSPVVPGGTLQVTGVTGTVATGNTLTVTGGGFGTKLRSKAWVFADFQNATHDPHPTLSYNTAWAQVENRQLSTGAGESRWGSGVSKSNVDYSSSSTTGKPATLKIPIFNGDATPSYGSKQMFSYWQRSDVDYMNGGMVNWKFGMRGYRTNPTSYPNITINSIAATDNDAGDIRTSMENWTLTTGEDRKYYGTAMNFPNLTWRQETVFVKYNAGVGQANGTFILKKNNTEVVNETDWRYDHATVPGQITHWFIQNVIANDTWPAGSHNWYADVYADDSWNHVVIGNASTYAACTQLEFQPYTAWSDTGISINCRLGTLSASANKWLYVLDNNLQVSNGYSLLGSGSNPAPVISSVSPSSGTTAGGTAITIDGANFDTSGVTIGGVACTSVVVVTAARITCVTPAGTAGSKNVVVTNGDAQTATLVNGYTYTAPPAGTSGNGQGKRGFIRGVW